MQNSNLLCSACFREPQQEPKLQQEEAALLCLWVSFVACVNCVCMNTTNEVGLCMSGDVPIYELCEWSKEIEVGHSFSSWDSGPIYCCMSPRGFLHNAIQPWRQHLNEKRKLHDLQLERNTLKALIFLSVGFLRSL